MAITRRTTRIGQWNFDPNSSSGTEFDDVTRVCGSYVRVVVIATGRADRSLAGHRHTLIVFVAAMALEIHLV